MMLLNGWHIDWLWQHGCNGMMIINMGFHRAISDDLRHFLWWVYPWTTNWGRPGHHRLVERHTWSWVLIFSQELCDHYDPLFVSSNFHVSVLLSQIVIISKLPTKATNISTVPACQVRVLFWRLRLTSGCAQAVPFSTLGEPGAPTAPGSMAKFWHRTWFKAQIVGSGETIEKVSPVAFGV